MNKKITDMFKQCKRMPVDEAFVDLLRVRLSETMEADVRMGLAKELVAQRTRPMFPMRRLVPAFLILSLLLTSGGTVFASQVSLPGETLYPVKLLSENVRIAVALTPSKKAELQVEYAAERTKEIDVVVALRATSTFTAAETRDIDHALTNYTRNLEGVGRHADELRERGDKQEARKLNTTLFEAATTYREALEKSASSTEEGATREHMRAVASSTEAIQKKAERESRDDENDFEQNNTSATSTKEGRRSQHSESNAEQKEIKRTESQNYKSFESASIEKAVKSAEESQKDEER